MSGDFTLCSATLGEDGKREPPLGPLYIAAAVKEAGLSVDFRDFQTSASASAWESTYLASFLDNHGSIVGISCFVDMLPVVLDATATIFDRRPDTKIILGGPGPSDCAFQLVERYPWIYGVVRSEGEETVKEWVRLWKQGQLVGQPIKGMVYRDTVTIIDGGMRERISSIDTITAPAYELVEWEKYTSARIITTRGCAYKCSFCDVTALWGNKSVYRDVQSAVNEMVHLRDKYGMTRIGIVDDTFVQNRRRVVELCKNLINRKACIEWGCFGRINLMSEELVTLMAEAGCRAIFYGIDSGSQAVLDRVHKAINAAEIRRVIEYSACAFDKVEASFIWGYPFESLHDFGATIDLAASISLYAPRVNVQLHMLSPLPNSPIYREFRNELVSPTSEDRPWLLLPPLLLDERAGRLQSIISRNPDLFPGFLTFRTPAKKQKLRLLAEAKSALDRTVGSTMFDERAARLVDHSDRDAELSLLKSASNSTEQIGVGLALGFLRRSRRRRGLENPNVFDGVREKRLVRQRNDCLEGTT